MHRYVWISSWTLHTTTDRLWPLLTNTKDWPHWWPQLLSTQCIAPGDTLGIGSSTRFNWRSGWGYRVHITTTIVRMQPQHDIEAVADGDVSGRGLWMIEPVDAGRVRVTYRWEVELQKAWMRFSAGLLAPIFRRRHFAVMHSGAAGMAAHLGCFFSDYADWASVLRAPASRLKVST